jgi:hypothetical protein
MPYVVCTIIHIELIESARFREEVREFLVKLVRVKKISVDYLREFWTE